MQGKGQHCLPQKQERGSPRTQNADTASSSASCPSITTNSVVLPKSAACSHRDRAGHGACMVSASGTGGCALGVLVCSGSSAGQMGWPSPEGSNPSGLSPGLRGRGFCGSSPGDPRPGVSSPGLQTQVFLARRSQSGGPSPGVLVPQGGALWAGSSGLCGLGHLSRLRPLANYGAFESPACSPTLRAPGTGLSQSATGSWHHSQSEPAAKPRPALRCLVQSPPAL